MLFLITIFFTLDEIINSDIDAIIDILQKKVISIFQTLKLLLKFPSWLVICWTYYLSHYFIFNVIQAYKDEIKAIDKSISKTIKGIKEQAYNSLVSISGIGSVFASEIILKLV